MMQVFLGVCIGFILGNSLLRRIGSDPAIVSPAGKVNLKPEPPTLDPDYQAIGVMAYGQDLDLLELVGHTGVHCIGIV